MNEEQRQVTAYRMANTYPCMGSLGKGSGHEIRPDSSAKPREMMCTMAIDGGAYRQVHGNLPIGSGSGGDEEAAADLEPFRACYCIGALPQLPPNCHPLNPTCGKYPNDPAKMPQAAHTLTGLEVLSLCTPYSAGAMVTNFDNKRAINNQPNALWQLLCGPINVPNADAPALVSDGEAAAADAESTA